MRYLQAVPRQNDSEPVSRPLTVVSNDTRQVVYLEEATSIEIITEALRAWGLRVRAERADSPEAQPSASESNWQTTRPEHRAPGRLENTLSPLWLPIRGSESGNEPVAAWAWFTSAA